MTVDISGGPGGSLNRDVTSIDDTDNPYTTSGEDILLVDTSGGAVTVTLSTADATADPESTLRIYDSGENASSNNITVNTEGSENINPGTLSSVTLSVDGTWIDLQSDGSNWFADLAPQVNDLVSDTVTTNTSLTDANSNTIADFTGERLSVDGSNVLNANNEVAAIDDTDSPYTTASEDIIEVDSSGGAVTVTLASADLDAGRTILVLDDAGSASTNTITIDTEGSETIDPGGDSSKSITTDHAAFAFEANGTNWNQVNANQEVEQVTAGDLVDGGGVSHTGRLTDLGELFLSSYDKTVGGGSITNNNGIVEVREPGNAGSASESRLYSHILEFDPSQTRSIRMEIQNVTIDNQSSARIYLGVTDTVDAANSPGNDSLFAIVRGDGVLTARTSNDGSNSTDSDASQDNAYVNGLESIEISWDGSSLTVTMDDGSTEVSTSVSSNYAVGENLQLKMAASDIDGSNARNVDFDIDEVVIDQ